MKKIIWILLTASWIGCSQPKMPMQQIQPSRETSFQLPPKWTETRTPTINLTTAPTRTLTDTPVPTNTPLPTKTIKQLATGMRAQPPSDLDFEKVHSIWTLTSFRELMAPGSNSYTVRVQRESVWLWDCYFCTTEQYFLEFIRSLDLQFRVDGQPLQANDNLRVFDRPGTKGWICRNWATLLSDWPPDRAVNLEIRYTYRIAVSDGKTDYPAGDYRQLIVAVVEG